MPNKMHANKNCKAILPTPDIAGVPLYACPKL